MFAFSMVVIAVFIGTIRLGQAISRSLSESDLGKSLRPGLCISFIAPSASTTWSLGGRENAVSIGSGLDSAFEVDVLLISSEHQI